MASPRTLRLHSYSPLPAPIRALRRIIRIRLDRLSPVPVWRSLRIARVSESSVMWIGFVGNAHLLVFAERHGATLAAGTITPAKRAVGAILLFRIELLGAVRRRHDRVVCTDIRIVDVSDAR